ncbi:MAG: 1-deoxy-D-xylulose-5-phosphate reductoisomerase [Oscillospiraceae bacterium]
MKISILGSTGSIGTQALEVVDDLKGIKDIEVVGLSANSNIKLLEAQIRKYNPKIVAVMDEDKAKLLKTAVSDTKTTVVCGESGLIDVSTHNDVDMVLSAIVGFAGLIPTMMAIEEGKDIALANKETLVTAGSIFMDAIKYNGVKLMPVDSEHCAIFQSLKAGNSSEVRKILLTASGGPFYGMTRDELKDITKKDALKHPNWSMGEKITVDSATLMNKGLEIMEARWLFNVPFDNIEVVVQRESIIHSMVEYVDNSVLAQMSLPSMKHPIQYAFTYPKRLTSNDESVSFSDIKNLSFGVADEETFRCLALAKQAGRAGGIMPTVLNAANEAAVAKFLAGEIKFLDIAEMVEDTMGKYKNIINPTLVDIIAINNDVRLRLATK